MADSSSSMMARVAVSEDNINSKKGQMDAADCGVWDATEEINESDVNDKLCVPPISLSGEGILNIDQDADNPSANDTSSDGTSADGISTDAIGRCPDGPTDAAIAGSSQTACSSESTGAATGAAHVLSAPGCIEEWVEMAANGDEHFKAGRVELALQFYSSALECFPRTSSSPTTVPTLSLLHSKKAFAHILLQQWESAEHDALSAMKLDDSNAHAKLEHCMALHHLGRVGDARAEIDEVMRHFDGDPAAVKLKTDINASVGTILSS